MIIGALGGRGIDRRGGAPGRGLIPGLPGRWCEVHGVFLICRSADRGGGTSGDDEFLSLMQVGGIQAIHLGEFTYGDAAAAGEGGQGIARLHPIGRDGWGRGPLDGFIGRQLTGLPGAFCRDFPAGPGGRGLLRARSGLFKGNDRRGLHGRRLCGGREHQRLAFHNHSRIDAGICLLEAADREMVLLGDLDESITAADGVARCRGVGRGQGRQQQGNGEAG